MRPSVLKEVLVTAFVNRQSILITGAPGIGKSDVTYQAVKEARGHLILSHPVCSDPSDYKGYPFPVKGEGYADFLPFGDLLALIQVKITKWLSGFLCRQRL